MRNFLCGFLALLATIASAHAQTPPSPIAKTELVIDAASIPEGGVVWAGVRFTLPDGWHIYWQNPGDSGIPTSYSWQLPSGLTAGDIAWPTPERIETSGLVNYGYSREVLLPVPLTAEKAITGGTLTVTAKWLVCHDICIPESATLSAALPTVTPGAAKQLEATLLRAPESFSSDVRYAATAENVTITVTDPRAIRGTTDAYFFPLEDGIINNATPQSFTVDPATQRLTLRFTRGSADLPKAWHGVLSLKQDDIQKSYQLSAALTAAPAATKAPTTPPAAPVSLLSALLLAFIGGLILNIMPCVLPILALKALAITKKAQASRRAAALQGLAYTAGVLVSFLLIAGLMIGLKASGAAIGWGFQLQHPAFVAFLTAVMLLVSANLLGLFELPVLFGNKATAIDDDKPLGSVLTGALAVLVATPCTAPFMASAIGATLTLPPLLALLVFSALGLGMAAPFLLISLWPAARRALPKPGPWMTRFKHLLAIPMLATAIWLIWILFQLTSTTSRTVDAGYEAYSPARLSELRASGTPVLVDATAAWCITCKVNERVALKPEEMQQFFRDRKVTLMVADWTHSDPAITEYLASFGRNGVPIYVYYPPRAEPVLLPQILTPSIVRDAIEAHD